MIVTMQARYRALHYDDAVAQAQAIWRDFIGDPEAALPWDASIRVELGSDEIKSADGEQVGSIPYGEAVFSAKVNKPSGEE